MTKAHNIWWMFWSKSKTWCCEFRLGNYKLTTYIIQFNRQLVLDIQKNKVKRMGTITGIWGSRQGNIDNLVQIYPGLCSVTRKLKNSAMFDFPVLFERSVSKKTYGTHISNFSTRIKLLLVSDKIKLLLLSNEYM